MEPGVSGTGPLNPHAIGHKKVAEDAGRRVDTRYDIKAHIYFLLYLAHHNIAVSSRSFGSFKML